MVDSRSAEVVDSMAGDVIYSRAGEVVDSRVAEVVDSRSAEVADSRAAEVVNSRSADERVDVRGESDPESGGSALDIDGATQREGWVVQHLVGPAGEERESAVSSTADGSQASLATSDVTRV